jgi:PHD/YefM family antitoxin component YafN of YafNO toxin-antitoxin module
MNAFSLLKATEYIGAKELRVNLNKILRRPDHPYRVMLRNKPAIAILPDEQYIELLEILEDLRESGLLEKTRKKLQEESKRKHPWFWSESWQKGEREADADRAAGRIKTSKSARALIKDLQR